MVNIFKEVAEFSRESLFEVSYSKTEGYTWSNGLFPWGGGTLQKSNITWQLAGPRGDGYFYGGNSGLLSGWGIGYPTQEAWGAYINANDEFRREGTILSEDELINKYRGKISLNEEYPYAFEGYIRLKYGTWESETDPYSEPGLNYGTNYRLLRYADVLLMAAEANNALGCDIKAINYLNQVRTRAGLLTASLSGTDLFEAIVQERRLELMFEGQRFPDLIRWGMAEDILGPLGYQPKHALFPIPQEILSNNPNMSQNPGW